MSDSRETKSTCKSIQYVDYKIRMCHSRSALGTVVVVTLGTAVMSSGDVVVVTALAAATDIAEAV